MYSIYVTILVINSHKLLYTAQYVTILVIVRPDGIHSTVCYHFFLVMHAATPQQQDELREFEIMGRRRHTNQQLLGHIRTRQISF